MGLRAIIRLADPFFLEKHGLSMTIGVLVSAHPAMAIFADFGVGRNYLISGWALVKSFFY
jgi:hypothetical protein